MREEVPDHEPDDLDDMLDGLIRMSTLETKIAENEKEIARNEKEIAEIKARMKAVRRTFKRAHGQLQKALVTAFAAGKQISPEAHLLVLKTVAGLLEPLLTFGAVAGEKGVTEFAKEFRKWARSVDKTENKIARRNSLTSRSRLDGRNDSA